MADSIVTQFLASVGAKSKKAIEWFRDIVNKTRAAAFTAATARNKIIKDRNIGPIKGKRSIESFPQKSWEEVLPKTKDSIIKGISEAIFEKLKGKRGNEALTVLNTIRYKTEKGKEIKMFVGDAFQWMIDASKGKVTEQFEKGDVAQKVVKLFVEDLFNSRRPRR